MALATIKLIPNQDQLADFCYGTDAEAWDWLSKTFTGTPVRCEVAGVDRGLDGEPDYELGVWIDGICVPYEWCIVTALTEEEAQIVKNFHSTN